MLLADEPQELLLLLTTSTMPSGNTLSAVSTPL